MHLGSTNPDFFAFSVLHRCYYSSLGHHHYSITFFINCFIFFQAKVDTYISAPTATHHKKTAVLRNKYDMAICQKSNKYAK